MAMDTHLSILGKSNNLIAFLEIKSVSRRMYIDHFHVIFGSEAVELRARSFPIGHIII